VVGGRLAPAVGHGLVAADVDGRHAEGRRIGPGLGRDHEPAARDDPRLPTRPLPGVDQIVKGPGQLVLRAQGLLEVEEGSADRGHDDPDLALAAVEAGQEARGRRLDRRGRTEDDEAPAAPRPPPLDLRGRHEPGRHDQDGRAHGPDLGTSM
jgi:hypothetical protein